MSREAPPISFKMECTNLTRNIGEIWLDFNGSVPKIKISSFDITGTMRAAEWEWAREERKNVRIHFWKRVNSEYGYKWNEEWVEFYLGNKHKVNSEVTDNMYMYFDIHDLRTKNKYFLEISTQKDGEERRNIESVYYSRSVFTTVILNHPYTDVEGS